jgi:hypothetical protein
LDTIAAHLGVGARDTLDITVSTSKGERSASRVLVAESKALGDIGDPSVISLLTGRDIISAHDKVV